MSDVTGRCDEQRERLSELTEYCKSQSVQVAWLTERCSDHAETLSRLDECCGRLESFLGQGRTLILRDKGRELVIGRFEDRDGQPGFGVQIIRPGDNVDPGRREIRLSVDALSSA
jgi:hypothetical protein